MNIREMNKPLTSAALNETMAKKFGTKIDVDSFTLEQLQDARNKIRTKQFDIETNESFSGLSQNRTYSKNKLFLDVLNAAISERADIAEAAKPDFLDVDKDGDKKEPMKKALKDKGSKPKKGKVPPQFQKESVEEGIKLVNPKSGKKIDITKPEGDAEYKKAKAAGDFDDEDSDKKVKETRMVDEGKAIIESYFKSLIVEGEEDKAELVMAAKDMVDRLTGWMEDTAEMQTESMLELADAIRDEMGAQQSESFTNAVKPALEQLYAAMESTRVALTQGVGMLTGEGGAPAADMGAELPAEEPVPGAEEMEPTVDTDEFAAAAPAVGGEEEAGRERRESRNYAKKKMIETSRRLGSILSSR